MEYSTFLGLDYPTLWFLLIGAVFSGYAILDGFDLGAGALHLFVKKEESRRVVLNAIGPVWDGNEVWIVIGGGALFAGFPIAYATIFSAFYIPFMLFLVALIFRAVAIEFRSKEPMKWWRRMWDVAFSLSSILIAFLLGVVLGNILYGIPMDENYVFRGSFLDFLNPYSLMVGVTTVGLFAMQGGLYLIMKTEERLFERLNKLSRGAIIFFVISFLITSFYSLLYVPHLGQTIRENPTLFAVPVAMLLVIANIPRQLTKRRYFAAFLSSSISIALLLVLVAVEIFPNLVYNPINPEHSLTIHAAAASDKSLGIMLTIAAIGVPLVAAYTTFVFWTFRGKVKMDEMSY
jgi:cytochrome d ubiquinol oxidase subunit II